MNILSELCSAGAFMPHGSCYLWAPGLVWLHVVSDGLIVLAYFSIPFSLAWLARKRQDIEFRWIYICFAIFIMACGTSHLLEIWNVWHAHYWLAGVVKAVTAVASLATAYLLFKLMPMALTLPSPRVLQRINADLAAEVASRKQAEAGLKELTEQLEYRVAERTAELTTANAELQRQILERDQAREALRLSLKESMDLRAALDEHAIVAITDPQGRITYVNDKFCAISKYSREELLGQDHRLINSGHHAKEFIRDLWATISQGQVWHGEIKNKAKDGTFYWVDTTIVPFLDEDGKPHQYVAIRADISARKAAEETIRQLNADLERRVQERTLQLEAANRELEAFSYSVSHDLRAPLRAVDGFSQAVMEDYSTLLPDEGKRYLQTIRSSAQHMGALIDDLLAFSRLSRLPLSKQSVDTVGLVRESLGDLRALSENRLIEIRTGELPPCDGDPVLLKQVWLNLISNALKYTGKRSPAVVEIGCLSENGTPVYFIRDNGVGFDMRYADKLFGVFQRLHRAEEYEGTGVGLAIVQRVVQRHGGRVWAEAAVDRGATFYFTLEGANS